MTMNDDDADRVHLNLRHVAAEPGVLPACDERCRRWGDLPHMHIKTEGLDDPMPDLTIILYCSCGFVLDEVHTDVSVLEHPELGPIGTDAQERAMLHHYLGAHGIDVLTNAAWLRAWATPP